jgi:DNA helicase-2/ATP-dependent DNA helicase PcrA
MSLDLNVLNPQQRAAVEHIEGPSMIIAGAGSGKTRVLTYKIANLISKGVSPFEILALTFTNKAANEMKHRIAELTGPGYERIWMGTFHSIFAKILRMEAEHIGFTRNFTIYDTDDSIGLIRQIMQSNNISTDKPTPKAYQNAISNLKNKLILPREFSQTASTDFDKKVALIYEDYRNALLKNNAMDFDDLLMKPIELFERFPEILEKYGQRFRFILVDEYQDTNKAQYIIVKLLAKTHRNVSVVGDDAQSIYKWRGAEIQNIFDFQTDFEDCSTFRLEQNYRSTQKILALAQNVITINKKQLDKTLWTDNDLGEHIHLVETMTDRDEALRICRYVFEEMQKKKLNFKDFVVLYRTNAQSRAIEEALRQNSIPYLIVGGIRFYQRKEIKDILSYLKLIVNPSDNEALLRALGLKEGIGKTSIDKLINAAETEGVQLFDIIKKGEKSPVVGGKARNIITEFLNFIYKYQYLKEEMSLKELAGAVIDDTGILYRLKLENTPESEERISNIQELMSAIAEFSDEYDEPTLENFLQQVSLVADIDDLDDKKNAVTLMTIHSAKGLEFPVVFVAGLEEGLFPVSGATLYQDELEEERRLFYVAITRAMSKLYLLYANMRYKFGIQSYQMKSRFLKEIPEDVMREHFVVEGLKVHSEKKSKSERQTSSGQSIRYEYYDKPRSTPGKRHAVESSVTDKFPDIQKGVSVVHDQYGKGEVLAVSGKGMDKKAEIYFEEVGLKRIMLRYAKMRVSSSG